MEGIKAPPNFQIAKFKIIGTSPYMQRRFVGQSIPKKMSTINILQWFESVMYKSTKGWHGIPTLSLHNKIIEACRMSGIKMTTAKLSFFVESDDCDEVNGANLIRITKGKPEPYEAKLPRSNYFYLRALWPQWEAKARVRYDANQFQLADVTNLMIRVGALHGIGIGGPDNKAYGTFKVKLMSSGRKS